MHKGGLKPDSCHLLGGESDTAIQSQKTVSAYFTGKQILHFGFAVQCTSVVQMKIVVIAYFKSKGVTTFCTQAKSNGGICSRVKWAVTAV